MDSEHLTETELDHLYDELSRAEQAQLHQWVVRDLGDEQPEPAVSNEPATFTRTRAPVWVV